MTYAPTGLSYLPYQEDGIQFLATRDNAILGDDMGLGKTVQICGLLNARPDIRQTLIICPASLKTNWLNELAKWCPLETFGVCYSDDWPRTPNVIMNYDLVQRHHDNIRARFWDALVMDEAHYLKGKDANRRQYVTGTLDITPIPARVKVAVTGTPLVNRPVELYPILRYLFPYQFPSYHAFGNRYCGGEGKVIFQSWGFNPQQRGDNRRKWETFCLGKNVQHRGASAPMNFWNEFEGTFFPVGMKVKKLPNYQGASNLDELNALLKPVMLRRMKHDVLKELPPKVRQVLELDSDPATRQLLHKERSLWRRAMIYFTGDSPEPDYEARINLLRDCDPVLFEAIAEVRRETAIRKVPYTVEHLRTSIEQGKVICFMHHKDSVKMVAEAFPGQCVTLTGDTSPTKRPEAVQRFQNDPAIRLFIGSTAAAEGLTLTASSHVVIAEWFWQPGIMRQMEDRAHRIGQKDSVLAQYLVLAGSYDSIMSKSVVRKQRIIDQVLN